MPQIATINIPVIDGVNYLVDTNLHADLYRVTGTTALTSNWAIAALPFAASYNMIHFLYMANVTLGGNHIFVFSEQMPDHLADKVVMIEAFYDGATWTVSFNPDFEESSIIVTDDISDDAVTNDKLANITRGSIKVGGVANVPTDLDAKTSGQILIGDGTDIKSVAVSGDATLASTGALTIANNAITNPKLASMVRGTIKVGGVGNAATDLNAKTAGQILMGNGTDLISVPVTGDLSITPAGVATVNNFGPVESGAGLGSIQSKNTVTGAAATGDYTLAVGQNAVASGDHSVSLGPNSIASGIGAVAILGGDATGNAALAIGTNALASGTNSAVLGGLNNQSTGQLSVSMGYVCEASGSAAIAMGNTNNASGTNSLARGWQSHANLSTSKAFGCGKFSLIGDEQKIDTILKETTTDATPTDLRLSNMTSGITIPTDCTANVDIRLVAVQVDGTAGTIGDSASQNIKLNLKNIAGVTTMLTMNAVTLANYSTVAGDVLYEKSAADAAFCGGFVDGTTVQASIAANKLQLTVTGAIDRTVRWIAYVSLVWIGYRNFTL